MSKDNLNVHVYADQTYAVFVADLGATLPTTLAAPGGTFAEVGLLGDAGIGQSHSYNENKIFDMSGALVRIARNQEERPITFVAMEHNAVTAGLLYPGTTVTSASSINTRAVGSATTRVLKAWVIDLVDGSFHQRFTIATGEAVATGNVTYASNGPALYEFTLQPFRDSNGNFMKIIDNDSGLTAP